MKIAVCVKQVPVREWQPRIDESGAWVREDAASYELNEPDAYALEEALRLRERHGGEVVVCAAGPARVQQVLREAMARGADRAIHVECAAGPWPDGLATARVLAHGLGAEACDLVLTGLQSDDEGLGVVGVGLAEYLGAAHATLVVDIELDERRLRVKRELEGGWFQHVTLPMPAVLTIQSGINQLRYATLKGIMAARKKELRTVSSPPDLAAACRIVSLSVPSKRKATMMIGGTASEAADELARRLRQDARVL